MRLLGKVIPSPFLRAVEFNDHLLKQVVVK